MGRALGDSGIARWVEHYGIVGELSGQSIMGWWNSSVGRALWDSGIAQWVEHYVIVG